MRNKDILSRGERPLHTQVAMILRNRIQAGDLAEGTLLPPEAKIAQLHGVSRPVVRQAMHALVQEGLIERTPGKGTLVLNQKRAQFSGWSMRSLEDLQSYGQATRFETIGFSQVPATQIVADALKIAVNSNVIEMRGTRYSGKERMAYIVRHMLLDVGRSIESADLSKSTLLTVIEEQANLTINRVLEAITAVAAEGDAQRILGVPLGSPILRAERLLISEERGAVLFSVNSYRPDQYRHISEMRKLSDTQSS